MCKIISLEACKQHWVVEWFNFEYPLPPEKVNKKRGIDGMKEKNPGKEGN